jgi:hypothetical protein
MAQYLFGSGNVSVDFSFDFKSLYGSNQFPVAQARGKGKIDIKAAVGRVDPLLFNTVMFDGSLTSPGETLNSVDESSTIPATPFTVTVANGATFSVDLGVYNETTGKAMTRVASAPATGQYSVTTTTGAYLFASADVGSTVKISYTYGSTSTGSTIKFTNNLLGTGVVFGVELVTYYQGKSGSLYFPAVQASKLSMPLKLDDFTLTTIDMAAQDDGSGNIFTMTLTG